MNFLYDVSDSEYTPLEEEYINMLLFKHDSALDQADVEAVKNRIILIFGHNTAKCIDVIDLVEDQSESNAIWFREVD